MNKIEKPICHLFIIGNGFDLEHKYPTSYNEFRKYLIKRFPGSDEYCDLVPEMLSSKDGDIGYDDEEVAGYISKILDDCSGGDWNNLEEYLGTSAIQMLENDLDLLDINEESDKRLITAYYNNEDSSSNMKEVFPHIKELFCDWIIDSYREFGYGLIKNGYISKDYKKDIATVIREGDGFLCFNYTLTLEKVYEIEPKKVCHIHGKVGDFKDEIFLGHGEDEDVDECFETLGAYDNLNEIKSELRKKTEEAWKIHKAFFEQLDGNLIDIHSFGFSFSDVDLWYVTKMLEKIDATKVVWYINKHDEEKRHKNSFDGKKLFKQIKKVEEMGFEVKVDNRW